MEQIQTKFRYFNTIRDRYEGNEILFDLPIRVYHWYKTNVKGNSDISFEQAQKKLSRNVYLGVESSFRKSEDRIHIFYGSLMISLNKIEDGKYEIGYINNDPRNYFKFYMDFEYRDYLNDRFGIIEDNDKVFTYKGLTMTDGEFVNFR